MDSRSLSARNDGSSADVHGDRELLVQLFSNLVENALRHTPTGTAITIEIGHGDDQVVVSVCDNGPGIPKEIQEKIWVSFFTTKGGSGGTGLGLSSVMQIVNQHGGSISLDSEAGKGAMFSVRLPVEK